MSLVLGCILLLLGKNSVLHTLENLLGLESKHPGILKLSKREKEIIGMICDQLTNDQIAKKLFLSKRTIDNHRQNILNKLGMVNTAGLVRFAVEHGLVNRA